LRIELKTEGGIAFFPGLAATFALDSATLGEDEAGRLTSLVEASGLLEPRSGEASTPPAGAGRASAEPARRGADARRYLLTIEDGRGRHTIAVADPLPARLAPLVEFLRARQRASRRAAAPRGRRPT
jgi:hypothetical protein